MGASRLQPRGYQDLKTTPLNPLVIGEPMNTNSTKWEPSVVFLLTLVVAEIAAVALLRMYVPKIRG